MFCAAITDCVNKDIHEVPKRTLGSSRLLKISPENSNSGKKDAPDTPNPPDSLKSAHREHENGVLAGSEIIFQHAASQTELRINQKRNS